MICSACISAVTRRIHKKHKEINRPA